MTLVGAGVLVAAIIVHQATSQSKTKPAASNQNSTEVKTDTKANSGANPSPNSGSVSVNNHSSSTVTVNGQTITTIQPVNVTITTNDSSASQTTIGVSKGAAVTMTFKVSSEGTYHGGLQFKSTNPNLSTGVIKPGGSATLKFTADHSFDFKPYWADGTSKNYMITIKID